MELDPPLVDIDAYLDRIGYHGDRAPTHATLDALHQAHAASIPFENLDVLLGRPIRLDLESVQAKLVRDKRGGYCFEHNLLFAAVLDQLGFVTTRLAARVRYGTTWLLPRTHMLLKVDIAGTSWLADVGFGVEGLLRPVALVAGREHHQPHSTYRLFQDAGLWVLQVEHDAEWLDLYAFTLEPQYLVDYEVASYYVSTHPDSIFQRTLTAQLTTPEVRYRLKNHELTEFRAEAETLLTIGDDEELLTVLSETFGLEFPSGTRFLVHDRAEG